MLRSHQEILAELDTTLDRLFESLSVVQTSGLDENEQNLLHNTQESLLARFVHVSALLGEKGSKHSERLKEKMHLCKNFNSELVETASKQLNNRPRIGRNRKKSKQGQFANRSL